MSINQPDAPVVGGDGPDEFPTDVSDLNIMGDASLPPGVMNQLDQTLSTPVPPPSADQIALAQGGGAPEITPTPLPMNPPVPPGRQGAIGTSIAGGGGGAGGVGGRGQTGGNAAQQGAFNLMNVIRSMIPKGAPPASLARPPMEGPLTAAPEPDWIKNRSRGLLN
jgi:hypothetical protein